MALRNTALGVSGEGKEGTVCESGGAGEVVFLLALEGDDEPNPKWGWLDRTINSLVCALQPSPVLSHVEIFIPTDRKGGEVHFSTYLGRHAAWGSEFGNDKTFYMGHNESKWRAIPIMGKNAIERVRQECSAEANLETPYSLAGYVFSVPPLRALANTRKNDVGDPAHCAALCSRVLTRAIPTLNLPCSDPWYGPSTLFIELSKKSRMSVYEEHVTETTPAILSLPEQQDIKNALENLLSGTNQAVSMLTTTACNTAVKHQAHLVIKERATASDPGRMRVLEKGLARMLLRWSLFQNEHA